MQGPPNSSPKNQNIYQLSERISRISNEYQNNSYNNYDASFNRQYLRKLSKKYKNKLEKKGIEQVQIKLSVSDLMEGVIEEIRSDAILQFYESQRFTSQQKKKPEDPVTLKDGALTGQYAKYMEQEKNLIHINQKPNQLKKIPFQLENLSPLDSATTKNQSRNLSLGLSNGTSRNNNKPPTAQRSFRQEARSQNNELYHHPPLLLNQAVLSNEDIFYKFLMQISPGLKSIQNQHLGQNIFVQRMVGFFRISNKRSSRKLFSFLKDSKILRNLQPYKDILQIDELTYACIIDCDKGINFNQAENSNIFFSIDKSQEVTINLKRKIKFLISLIDEQFMFTIHDVDHYLLNRLIIEPVHSKKFKQNILYFQQQTVDSEKIARKIFKSIIGFLNADQTQILGEIIGTIFVGISTNEFFPKQKLITGITMNQEKLQHFKALLQTMFTTATPIRLDELVFIKYCQIVLPDSFGRSCYKVENKHIIEISIFKPVNNFLFGTSNFAYYKWNREESQIQRMNKQDIYKAKDKNLFDDLVAENALVSLKIRENQSRLKSKAKRMQNKKSILCT